MAPEMELRLHLLCWTLKLLSKCLSPSIFSLFFFFLFFYVPTLERRMDPEEDEAVQVKVQMEVKVPGLRRGAAPFATLARGLQVFAVAVQRSSRFGQLRHRLAQSQQPLPGRGGENQSETSTLGR